MVYTQTHLHVYEKGARDLPGPVSVHPQQPVMLIITCFPKRHLNQMSVFTTVILLQIAILQVDASLQL